ncbi:MAG: hypothetical protein VCC00_03235 [Deltaproteobacteria bacterium]
MTRALRIWRALLLLVAVATGFLLAGLCLIALLEVAEVRTSDVDLDQIVATQTVLAAGEGSGERVVFLGDSLSFSAEGRPSPLWIAGVRMRNKFNRPDIEILNLSIPGFTTFSHYLTSEAVAELGAGRVIIGVNLSWFSRARSLQQPVLAGLLPASRWWEAAGLPLHSIGLSAADLLTYRSIVAAGYFEWWRWLRRQQVRIARGYAALVTYFQKRVGAAAGMRSGPSVEEVMQQLAVVRPTAADAKRRLASVLQGLAPDNPDLLVLEALVARHRAAGSEVLVLIQPTNIARLIGLGVYDHAGMGASLGRLRAVAARQGADFLDLHDLLPGRSFRDGNDHLEHADATLPAGELALRIVPWALGYEDWAAQVDALPSVRAHDDEEDLSG